MITYWLLYIHLHTHFFVLTSLSYFYCTLDSSTRCWCCPDPREEGRLWVSGLSVTWNCRSLQRYVNLRTYCTYYYVLTLYFLYCLYLQEQKASVAGGWWVDVDGCEWWRRHALHACMCMGVPRSTFEAMSSVASPLLTLSCDERTILNPLTDWLSTYGLTDDEDTRTLISQPVSTRSSNPQ